MTTLTLNLADFFASIQQRLGEIKTDIAADGFVGDAPTPGVGDGDDATITIDFDSVLKNGTGGDDNGVLALQGDGHFNILNAMGGNDVLIGKGGLDILLGGAGIDTADYSYLNGNGQGVFADLAAQLAVGGVNDVDILHSLENLIGSQHDDVLLGNSGNNVFQGNGGNDFIDGRDGTDVAQFHGAAEEYTVEVLFVGEGESATAVGYTFERISTGEITKVIGIELVQFKDASSGGVTLFALNEGGEGSLIAIDDTIVGVDEDAGHVTPFEGDDETAAVVLDLVGNDQELGDVTATHPVLGLVDGTGALVESLDGIYGTLTYDPTDGTVTYRTNASADALQVDDEPLPETFKYRVAGGDEAIITINITPTNDDPVLSGNVLPPSGVSLILEVADGGDVTDAGVEREEGTYTHLANGSFTVADVDSDFGGNPIAAAGLVTWDPAPEAIFIPHPEVEGEEYALPDDFADVVSGSITNVAVEWDGTGPGAEAKVSWNFELADSHIEFLGAGDKLLLNYTFHVADEQGGSVDKVVTISITGTNDVPVITVVNVEGAVVEDVATVADNPNTIAEETGAYLTDSGSVSFADADDTDLVSSSVILTGTPSTTSASSVSAALSTALASAVTLAQTGTNDGTIDWSFALDNDLVQYLAEDETVTATYTISVQDDSGQANDSQTQTITVTITGANDGATIAGEIAGEVTEDGDGTTTFQTVSGTLIIADVDAGEDEVQPIAAGTAGTGGYGTFTVAANGEWTYTLNNGHAAVQALGVGDPPLFDTILVTSKDGTDTETITITITGANDGPVINDAGTLEFVRGFDGADDSIPETPLDFGTVTLVNVGEPGYVSGAAGGHALLSENANATGPFTRFDGYRSEWSGDWTSQVKVYLDASWQPGEGFDYSVAANGSDGLHQRDFVFHVAKDADTGQLLINASNNSGNGLPRTDLDTGTFAVPSGIIGASDWYTLQHDFYDDNGVLAVKLSLIDAAGIEVWSTTLSDPTDTIGEGGTVGGNRYGWFTLIDVGENGLAVDGLSLNVANGETLLAEFADGDPMEGSAGNGVHAANGEIPFTDIDLNDAHSVSVTSETTGFVGAFTPQILAGDEATGGNQGKITWSFTVADSEIEYLGVGEMRSQTYTIQVDDSEGGTDTVDVTVTITGANDGPAITVVNVEGAVVEDVATVADNPNTIAEETGAYLTDSGSVSFADADDTDLVSSSVILTGTPSTTSASSVSAALSTALASAVTLAQTGTNDGTIDWSFALDNDLVQYLAEDETVTATYTISVQDDSGQANDSQTQTITVTITGANDGPVINDAGTLEFVRGFDGVDDSIPETPLDFGTVTLVNVGEPGYVSGAEGGGHALLSENANATGPFTRFDGYRSEWSGDWTSQVKVYLDASWQPGEGFDYSVAANGSDGLHQRDFVFHVAKDADTGQLLINASNNSGNGLPRTDLDTGTFAVPSGIIGASDWYTLQHDFYDDNGVLAVKLSLIDAAGIEVWSTTLSDPTDTIGEGGTVGGNRYGWFTLIDVGENGLAVDGLSLNVANGETLLAEFADGDPMEGSAGNGVHAANGEIPFTDIDLNDAHSVSVTSETTGFVGAFTPQILAGDEATGGNQGKITWSFTVADSEIEYLGVGEMRSQTYTIQVDDSEGGTDTVDVTVTITGANDGPAITVVNVEGAVVEDVATVADNPNTIAEETGAYLTDSGSVSFADADDTDLVSSSVILTGTPSTTSASSVSAALSTALASAVTLAQTGTNDGTIDWSFALDNDLVQYLAEDETVTATYTISVQDDSGQANDSQTQTITVTITGANDGPVITVVNVEGAVVEDVATVADNPNTIAEETGAYLTDSGSVSFADADDTDLVSSSVILTGTPSTTSASSVSAALSTALASAVTLAQTGTNDGTIDWSFALDNDLVQYLAEDETVTATYTISVQDDSGQANDSQTQTITVTITGANDVITITTEELSGEVDELIGTPAPDAEPLQVTGDIGFDDVDISDVHVLTNATPGAATVQSFDANGVDTTTTGMAALGTFAAEIVGDTVTWTFSVDPDAVEHLADGEKIVQTYVLEIDDQNGDTVQKSVEITINGTNNDPVISDAGALEFVRGFDSADDSIPETESLGYGTVELVGLGHEHYQPTAEGGGHALLSENANATGPFTRFDGYRSEWSGDWTSQVKVYLDASWQPGEGFDYSVAANGSDGLHQRDFVFHVAKDADTGQLLINASNNSGNGLPRTDLDTGTFAVPSGIIGASDWYTLQHDFYDDNGVLAVKLSLIDAAGIEVWSTTLSDPTDTIGEGGTVGGNRYGWFTLIDVGENGLAVDGLSLNVANGETLLAEFADGDPMEGSAGNGVHAANGEIPFTDIDLNDAHSVSVTSETTGFVGAFTPQILAGDEATGGNQGKITWSFTVADSEIEYLGVGEMRSQTYTIQVDDSEGGTDTVDVTVTITGANDGPTITVGGSEELTEGTDVIGTPAMLETDGELAFTDLDLLDTHGVTFEQTSAERSDGEELPTGLSDLLATAFNAALGDLATGDGAGTIDWTFSLADSAVDFLGFGETLTIVYDVTVTDDAGTLDTKQVTVTIYGTNDAPEINEGTSIRTGTVFEDGDLDDVTEAGPTGPFDANQDLDAFIEPLIVTGMDMATALDQVEAELGPNANPADAIAQVWDYLDEHYAYYENVVNEAFARLGVEYAKYLQSGGRPLTDVMAKYAGDVDLDGTPDRQQSLHDNLLGNLDSLSLIDKLATNVPEVYDDIVQLLTDNGLSDLSNDRPIYNGNEDVPNLAQAWDQLHGLLPLASGQIVFSDVDGTAQASVDTTTAQLLYNGAAVSTTNPLPTGLSAAAIAAAFVIGTDGAWAYNANQAHLNALAEGDTLELTYTVVVSDGDLQDMTPVTITITGTNDAPTIDNFSGDAFTEVELAGLVGTGGVGGIDLLDQFRGDAKDVDVGDSVSIVADGSDEYGVPDGLDADLAVHLETMFGDIDFNLPIEELIEAGLMELGTDGTFSIKQEFADALELLLNTGDSVSVTGSLTVVDTHGATATAEIDLVLNGSDGLPEDLADNYGTGDDDIAPAFLEAAVPVFDQTPDL